MSAADILSDNIQHGTVAGYRAGCTTNHCPASGGISCATMFVRYNGDYGFRRLVDAGATAAELIELDRTRAQAARVEADREPTSQKGERPPVSGKTVRPRRTRTAPPAATSSTARPSRAPRATVVDQELVDRIKGRIAAEQPVGRDLVDTEFIDRVRARIADMQTPPPAPRAARKPRAVRQRRHGTMYQYQLGCRIHEDCPNVAEGSPSCWQVNSAYHREYIANRRANQGAGSRSGTITHGTPTGYQLGCHDRDACPGGTDGITCPDASLAAERRRRRNAGVPARELVDAAPARRHIERLRESGMRIDEIAAAAGIPRNGVATLIYGKYGGGYNGRVPEKITSTNAQKILAV